jgi:phenylalanyl-tRNA synthetase beta chain
MIHTLDGEERMIPAKALVIQMEKKTVALAGIMGDLNSSISEKTKNVMIEAAVFHPTNIRKASKELSLKTEASQRFEKGVDPLMVPTALNLATELLMQLAGGVVHTETVECNLHPFTPKRIVCRKKRVESLLGISLSLGEIAKLLERLQIEIIQEHLESLEVRIPSHRNDLREEVDLIEEIARLYGLCHLPKKAPLLYTSTLVHAPLFSFENLLRDLLLQEGLQEFMTCDLISPTLSELTRDPAQLKIKTLSVLQSKSSDYSVLRHSLLPGLLQVVQYNEAHQNKDIAGFEVGRLHFEQSGVYQEPTSCAILLSGLCRPHHQDPKPCSFDFFDLKGLLENLFAALHVEDISFEPSHLPYFQPGRQAYVIQKQKALCLGALGELHPSLLKQFDLSSRAYFAELNVHHLLELHSPSLTIKDLPLYPSSERDWTVSLLKETPIEKVLACIRKLAPSLLERVFLLDLFESDKIGCDRKNATWRFIYRDPHKTLDLKTVEQKHSTLLQMVAEKLHDCIL